MSRQAFDFVGRVDAMASDIEPLSKVLGRTLRVGRANEGQLRKQAEWAVDAATLTALGDLLADDITLYENWCA
jgi:hypothetical protein